MTLTAAQWQEAIVQLANAGITVTADSATNGATGANVPADADYIGISDQSGKIIGVVSANTAHGTNGGGLLGVSVLGGSAGSGYYTVSSTNGANDGVSGSTTGLSVTPMTLIFNGTSWDRQLSNYDNVTLLASAAHTTTQTIDNITNYNHRGVVICVDTTVVPGSAPSNVVTILGKDPVSGKYNTLLTGAAITGVGTAFYTIYPGATVAANVTVSQPLPRTYKVVITAGNANSATYSVGASYIL